MSKEIEIEFKTLLTKEEYVNLCTKFADKRGNLQINYYFDTPRFTLKASEIGLRVRKSDKYVMTLKRKKGYALQEINETISEEVFQQFLKDGIIPVEEIRNELEDVLKGQKVINYMSLSTLINVNMLIRLIMNLSMKLLHMKVVNVNLLRLFANLELFIKRASLKLNVLMMH